VSELRSRAGRLRRLWRDGFTRRSRIRNKRSEWERQWEVEAARPDEDLSQVLPIELKKAVADGWFPPDAEVMDIGSGRGQIAAWLADHGYAVMAGELTEAGTKLAEQHYGGRYDRLEFRVLDICLDEPEPARFGALLDRGTFHTILDELRGTYVENVATWARPGARFLLFYPLKGDFDMPLETRRRRLDKQIREEFAPYFECERSASTEEDMVRSAGEIPRRSWPGMVFWMVRR
jgi:SAM-dependent methyltransferase